MNFKLYSLLIVWTSFISCRQEPAKLKMAEASPTKNSLNEEEIQKVTTKINWLKPPFKHWSIKNVDKLFSVGYIIKGETSATFNPTWL